MLLRIAIDAFVISAAMEQAVDDLPGALTRAQVKRRRGGMAAAAAHYQSSASPDLVVIEDDGDAQALLDGLERLAEVCLPTTRVVVIGAVNDIVLYRALAAKGVSEYLLNSVTSADLAAAIVRVFADPSARPAGRLIAFIGARGGVGSSALSHNVAWSLGRLYAEDVLLLDLDLAFGTSGLSFNAESRETVGEVLGEPARIDSLLVERIVKKHYEHLHLLPAPAVLREWPAINIDALDRLFDVARQMAAFVVVDLPHQWAPWVQHTLQVADQAVIVAQPDLPNLRDAKNLLDAIVPNRPDKPPLVVLNKFDAYKRSQLTVRDFEDTLKVKLAARLPFEPLFGQTANDGQMLGELAATHKLTEAIFTLAASLAGRPCGKTGRRSVARKAWGAVATKLKIAKVVK